MLQYRKLHIGLSTHVLISLALIKIGIIVSFPINSLQVYTNDDVFPLPDVD